MDNLANIEGVSQVRQTTSEGMNPFLQGLLVGVFLPVGLIILVAWVLNILGYPLTGSSPIFEVWVLALEGVYLGCWVGPILLGILSKQPRRRELVKGTLIGLGALTGAALLLAVFGFMLLAEAWGA